MLKGIQKVCKLENRKSDLYGYYLVTHAVKNTGIRAIGFAMNQGKPDDKYPIKALTDYGYTISVLELMFSAPHPSILGVKKEGTTFLPIYQSICEEEEKRQKISAEILYGIQNFISDFQYVGSKFPVSVEANSGLIPVEYIATKISNYDKNNISSIHFFPGVGNDMTSHPIVRNGKIKFGIVFPWPGSTNAETEIILRIKRAAQENGMECVPIDNFGHILDDALCRTSKDEIISNPDFIITTHFETPKLLDTFYYHTLWNPPEYPLNEGYGDEVLNNYLMNDDYLIYDKGSMTNHLKSMLLSCPRTLKGASQLMSTFPKSAVMKANLSNPKIFYCGTNWDKMVTGKTRHEGLLKLMDNSGMLKIYGPDYVEGWGGVWPWEGYQCYQHPIPFDGFSLLKELNQCGICLVISSDVHRRAGAVTIAHLKHVQLVRLLFLTITT
jgi:hypothetical protein